MEIKRLVPPALFIFVAVLSQFRRVQSQESTGDLIPCDRGWFYFENMCYYLGGTAFGQFLNYSKSVQKCRDYGGDLVAVKSKGIQDFIVAFLQLDIKIPIWIGLRKNPNSSQFEWVSGDPVQYTNWAPHQPSGAPPGQLPEDCVEMFFMPVERIIGQWNDIHCYHERPYICQKVPNTGITRSVDPRFCGSGWKLGPSCYKLYTERKSWYDAEQYCVNEFQGHLVSIRDVAVDFFLDYILSNLNKEIWIGIKIKEQIQQKWSAGFHVAYNDWSPNFRDFVDGTCTLRMKADLWGTDDCNNEYPFVCEKTEENPPVLPPAPKGARCPSKPNDWRDLDGDYCYYFEFAKFANWYRGNFECMRRGGSLVSIHSKVETEVLTPFLYHREQRFYIGLYRTEANDTIGDLPPLLMMNTARDNNFVWSDRTPLNYKNWFSTEPSDEDELCGEMWSRNMMWYDADCDEVKGYICSVKKVLPEKEKEKVVQELPPCDNLLPVGLLVGIGVSTFLNVLFVALLVCCRRRQPFEESNVAHYEEPGRPNQKWSPNAYSKNEIDDDSLYENMH